MRRDALDIDGQGVSCLHAQRRGVDHDVEAGRVGTAGDDLQRRVVLPQPSGQRLHDGLTNIEKRQSRHPGGGQRRGNGRAHAATAHHQCRAAPGAEAVALHAEHEALAIEHVAFQTAVRRTSHGVAGAGDAGSDRDAIEQRRRGALVRHGDERPHDVARAKERSQQVRITVGLRGEGNDHHVLAHVGKPGIVDHRGPKGLGGIADVGEQARVASDHAAVFRMRGCQERCAEREGAEYAGCMMMSMRNGHEAMGCCRLSSGKTINM